MKFTLQSTFDACAVDLNGNRYLLIKEDQFYQLFECLTVEPRITAAAMPAVPPIADFVEECLLTLKQNPRGLAPWELEQRLRENTSWGFVTEDVDFALQELLLSRRATNSGLCLWKACDRSAVQAPEVPPVSLEAGCDANKNVCESVRDLSGGERHAVDLTDPIRRIRSMQVDILLVLDLRGAVLPPPDDKPHSTIRHGAYLGRFRSRH